MPRLAFPNCEVIVALAAAGSLNMAMVMMASSAFHAATRMWRRSRPRITRDAAARRRGRGGISAVADRVGQFRDDGRHHDRPEIMQGFVFRIPVWVRRLPRDAPASSRWASMPPTRLSSAAHCVPWMIALLMFSPGARHHGAIPAHASCCGIGTVAAPLLTSVLILQIFGIALPGLPVPG